MWPLWALASSFYKGNDEESLAQAAARQFEAHHVYRVGAHLISAATLGLQTPAPAGCSHLVALTERSGLVLLQDPAS